MMRKVNELVAYLKQCDDAYYGSGDVLVSNDTYDSLVETLKRMDPTNPYLDKVGFQPNGTNKVGRLIPMGTLDKFHEEDKVKEWLHTAVGVNNPYVLLSPKYDGFGVELTYVNGKLVMASTRGDGITGEDVTEAMMLVPSVPKELPEAYRSLTCVRGECIIPRANHDAVKALGYKAMRNAVPGIVRSCQKEALPYCDYVAYEFFDGTDDRENQRLCFKNIFNIEDYKVFKAEEFSKILEARNQMGENKDSYIYEMDGVVLKTRPIKPDDYRHPAYQIAWKFKSNRRETVLRGVEFALGVTGKFTPKAIFDPVEFQGASLTSASLGSMDRYYKLAPAVGDVIEVSRRNDVIPYVENVAEHTGEVYVLEVCPHCGSNLVNNKCVNKSCSEILYLQVRNYIGVLGVKGIGPALVRQLVTSGKVARLPDIYNVTKEDIINLPRQGESTAEKWFSLINKELDPVTFLSAMPFDNIGVKAWEALLSAWSFKEVLNLTENKILNAKIKGFGQATAREFISQLSLYKSDIYEMYHKANIKHGGDTLD